MVGLGQRVVERVIKVLRSNQLEFIERHETIH